MQDEKVKGRKVTPKVKTIAQTFCIKKTNKFTINASNYVREQLKVQLKMAMQFFSKKSQGQKSREIMRRSRSSYHHVEISKKIAVDEKI